MLRSLLLVFFIHKTNADIGGMLTKTISSATGGELSNGLTNQTLINSVIQNLTVPIRLSKKKSFREIEELDCTESMFMSPYHDAVPFSLNNSVNNRHDPTCKWNFFGTEPCIPMLTCLGFNLMPPDATTGICKEEYLEVFDGNGGQEKYCGKTGPINITAANDLRDLYILYNTTKKNKNIEMNCKIVCSSRGEGHQLKIDFNEKINRKCSCGTKVNDDRIVGGVTAEKNEFPWLVALVEANTRQPFCGGSIINDRMILTAGHCFKGRYLDIRNLEVLINAHKLDSTPNTLVIKDKPLPKTYELKELQRLDLENGTRRHQPEEVFVHPLYVSETNDFDVALILLSKPIDFLSGNKTAKPICLPELGSYLRTFAGKKATVAGWGLESLESNGTPENLQKVDVQVFQPQQCKSIYAHRVNRRMMCAGFVAGGQDSCSGDSGGPLVLEDKNKVWYQIASVSWGDGCAKEQSPGVYFRTTESGQWAHFNSNKNDAVWCQVPK